jgi:hypothetical protein
MGADRRSRSTLERQWQVDADDSWCTKSADYAGRDLNDFQCLLASWNERCANYEHAYCLEVERNKQINKAYQLLVCQHSKALNDLRLHASKF